MPKSATEVKEALLSDHQREKSHSAPSLILRDYGIYIILVITPIFHKAALIVASIFAN